MSSILFIFYKNLFSRIAGVFTKYLSDRLHNAQIVDEKISQICKDFLKFGGGENILVTFKTNINVPDSLQVPDWFPTKIVPIYHFIKNQADWLIVYAHGWVSNFSGGIVEDKKFRISITPRELINQETGKSEYAEDMEVLVLICCECLRWIGDYDGSERDFDFARGWHKVLPHGVILGYSKTITQRIAEETVTNMKPLLDNIHENEYDKLIEIWQKVNEQAYEKFMAEKVDLSDPEAITQKQVRLDGCESASIIYGNKYINYKSVPVSKNDQIGVVFIRNIINFSN